MNEKLAKELIRCVHSVGKCHHHKQINDSVRGENMALGFIKSEGGSTYPKEIELAMGISSARVAAIIKKLEQRNLVIRTDDKIDRRKTLVTLTEQGEEVALETEKKIMYALSKMFDYLGEEDSENFVRIIDKLIKNLPKVSKDCEEKFKEMDDNFDKNI
ncbi:MarR family transcriptional regulator [Finegoldia magna]|uniref:MarR family transcriptional regulator n=1 Tax=Finegoldia magna TaxID=1260 RepID=A0A233VWR7_FINMA|nr:MarR family transcriptional regulator [Finegoldia magna]OXZ36847.1 MarR family transcriptional regulator [Finegoldia magna]